MNRSGISLHALGAGLSALAGFVDALGFLKLNALFVSFMSGNTTRLAVDLVHERRIVGLAAALIALFVAGVVAGTLVARVTATWRATAVLLVVALLLAIGAACGRYGLPLGAVACMTLAMGAQNIALEHDGAVTIGRTYITGTLVKIGQQLVATATGGDRWGWFWTLLLWLGLVAGAAIGAAIYPMFGLTALWFAAGTAAVLAAVARATAEGDAPHVQ